MTYISSVHNERLTNKDNCNNKYRPHPKHVHSVYKCNIAHKVPLRIIDSYL